MKKQSEWALAKRRAELSRMLAEAEAFEQAVSKWWVDESGCCLHGFGVLWCAWMGFDVSWCIGVCFVHKHSCIAWGISMHSL